ncbi:UNVERIFIED_CONTAM: hypothetical protein Sangu_0699100 [Sesamum angustifolium]|uniref:Transposase n=1 Tax=Sesamum angustifolium TaxID=2727405 RepID=A0AAW2PTK0_9LAMI
MHIEKNMFDNIFNTVMDIKGKSKDNLNARKDLAIICNRPELQVDERRLNVMPKAVYTLTKDQKRKVCEWVKCLRFPDGYASNLSRCVDMTELRLHGMKSHDCHIFMQKLIPVAFREMVPEHVWSALTEVSLMFQVLCSTTLDIRKVQELEDSVAVIMCNLEKVFPPAFFDSMEHLILHLPYEARVEGPYSIGGCTLLREDFRDIFNHPGRPSGALKKRYATGQERHMMETYVLCNSEVAAPYYEWFKSRVESELQNIEDDLLRSLYWGPKQLVKTWPCYFVNRFNFHTEDHNVGTSNMNCGVCVKSSSYRDTENDFYGMLEEIIELDYPLNDDLHVVLFKCRWVDPTRGMKVHPHYHLVDVNFKRVYQKDEPFILAQQAVQVYYTEYPSMKRDKIDWMAVCKTKARRVESHWTNVAYEIDEEVPVPEQSLGRRPLAANHQLALAPAPPPALIPVTAKPRAPLAVAKSDPSLAVDEAAARRCRPAPAPPSPAADLDPTPTFGSSFPLFLVKCLLSHIEHNIVEPDKTLFHSIVHFYHIKAEAVHSTDWGFVLVDNCCNPS